MSGRGHGALAGKRVVVTRPRSQGGSLGEKLEAAGAIVIEAPVIAVAEPESWAPVDAAIARLIAGDYSWIAFLSANGAEKFLERVATHSPISEAFASVRVAAVGSATRGSLEERGVQVSFVPAHFTARSMEAGLGPGSGGILVPRAAEVPPDLRLALETDGWRVDEVTVYRTVAESPDSPGLQAVRSGDFDIVTFTSGSTARHFVELVGLHQGLGLAPQDDPRRIVACIGPVTSRIAGSLGLRVDVVAEPHTAEGLVHALEGMGT